MLRRRRGRPTLLLLLSLVALLLVLRIHPIKAIVSCNETYNPCEELLWKGSECRDGVCTNPFEKGCLYSLLNEEEDDDTLAAANNTTSSSEAFKSPLKRLRSQVRICNSEDPPEAADEGICMDYTRDNDSNIKHLITNLYDEIRIHSQNWESAFFIAWIMQILLSEVLQVPATIETGLPNVTNNFYDPYNAVGYGVARDWDSFRNAAAHGGDCVEAKRRGGSASGGQDQDEEEGSSSSYVSCSHIIPEHWDVVGEGSPYNDQVVELQESDIIVKPQALGAVGFAHLFVTKFTAEMDPPILTLIGLEGEKNRHKLAELFHRPTTWKDYCEIVSPSNCTVPDDVPQRPPQDETDFSRMHVPNLYTGHFRPSDKNDCIVNPMTCSGFVGDFPCYWESFVPAWMHHHNIALDTDLEVTDGQGHSYQQLLEMWKAANATKSNLIAAWYAPEALHAKFLGTESEMLRVSFPAPTQECFQNRVPFEQRCKTTSSATGDADNDPTAIFGDPRGACDTSPQPLYKIISASLLQPDLPEALQNPAFDLFDKFHISHVQLAGMLKAWINQGGVDLYGFDLRLATCRWVRDNLEGYLAENTLPYSHPRISQKNSIYDLPLYNTAMAIALLASLLTLVSIAVVYQRKHYAVMQFAQVDFLCLLLFGLFLVSLGSITLAIEPSDATCILSVWLVNLGYSLELVPQLVKVAAINKLTQAAKRMQRTKLNRQYLFSVVFALSSLMVLFLILWTALDPQQLHKEFTLTDDTTDLGETVVLVNYYCASESQIWRWLSVLFHVILLISSAVLAFQSRNIEQRFNESRVLGTMIYSHCIFVVFRVCLSSLEGSISVAYWAGIRSLIFSSDVTVTICIYFIPKFFEADQGSFRCAGSASSSRRSSQMRGSTFGTFGSTWGRLSNRFSGRFSLYGGGLGGVGNTTTTGTTSTRNALEPGSCDTLRTKCDGLEVENEALKAEIAELQEENALRVEMAEMELENTLRARCEDLETENAALRAEISTLQQEQEDNLQTKHQQDLETENAALKARISSTMQQEDNLQTKYQELQEENELLKGEISTLQEENATLKAKIA